MRTDAAAARITDVLARMAEVRRHRARHAEAAARRTIRQRESQRAELEARHRQAEEVLLAPGRSVPAAVVQLVDAARTGRSRTLGTVDRILTAERRELSRREGASLQAAHREMAATRIAEYVRTARRTELSDKAQTELEETVRSNRVADELA
ncbi:MAG: hypothetical protein ACQEXJ_21705 [Myxococcota bacterium]